MPTSNLSCHTLVNICNPVMPYHCRSHPYSVLSIFVSEQGLFDLHVKLLVPLTIEQDLNVESCCLVVVVVVVVVAEYLYGAM